MKLDQRGRMLAARALFLAAALLSFGVGLASNAAKQAFDALVQRDAPDANRGRAFARFSLQRERSLHRREAPPSTKPSRSGGRELRFPTWVPNRLVAPGPAAPAPLRSGVLKPTEHLNRHS